MDLPELSQEQLQELLNEALAQRAQGFTPLGFAAYYELKHGNSLPGYAMEFWIKPIFAMKEVDKGGLIHAFRASWKTTTIGIDFTEFFIGHHPERSNLVISASGGSANFITEAITSSIEHSKSWELTFPDVAPDRQKGWGEKGYWVRDTSMLYREWQKEIAHQKDPTLLGLGITSKNLIGKHPDGILLMDDIIDEEIASSPRRQLPAVEKKVTGTILPFIVDDDTKPEGEKMITWVIAVGTPWVDGDVYDVLKDTGEFMFTKVPLMKECEEGEGTYFNHKKLTGWYKILSERHSQEIIKTLYNRVGHKEFFRMYLLDKSVKSAGHGLKFYQYPHDKIDPTWSMVCGVDYASVLDESNYEPSQRSYYAQLYLMKIPGGGAVVFDGIHKRCTQAKAESYLATAETFPGHRQTIFERDGKGAEALQVFLRNPGLRINPQGTGGIPKPTRIEKQLGPWLENGTIMVSDADTPFLNFLRKALRMYPDYYLDPLDALYWAAKGMPEVLTLPKKEDELPPENPKPKSPNPFHSLKR